MREGRIVCLRTFVMVRHHALGNITALSDPKSQVAVREIRPKEGAATSTVVEGAPYTHTEGPHCHPLTVKVGSGGSQWGPPV